MIERRKSRRYELPLAVAVEQTSDEDVICERTHLLNIGLGGAYFRLLKRVELGSLVDMNFLNLDPKFASSLGLSAKGKKNLRFKIQGRVVRLEESLNELKSCNVAVEFNSPLRIVPNPDFLRAQSKRMPTTKSLKENQG